MTRFVTRVTRWVPHVCRFVFFLLPLCCLSFALNLLISLLVSSNFSMLHYYHDNNSGVRGVVFTTIIPSYRGGNRWLWIMVCYAEPVVVNHGLLCWASGCKSLYVILCQWLWIMVYYYELVVVNDVVLFWASGGESWYDILSQWLWIMVSHAEPVVVNHGV
jgi:hypothetical protein